MANIGMEVLKLALEDAELKHQEIEELMCNPNTDGNLLNLTHQQTVLISSITELFNRIH